MRALIDRVWIWAVGPRGEGFALFCAIVIALGFYALCVAGIVAVVGLLVAVFG